MISLNHKSVLIVDDDAAMIRALRKVLSGEGVEVTATEEAAEAVEILNQHNKSIDLVITDLRMPFVSGITLLHAIHKNFPAMPVIVLTAYASPQVKKECQEQGAVDFLEKPLDAAQLLGAVERAFCAAGKKET